MEYFWIALVLAAVLPLAWHLHRRDVKAVHDHLARQAARRGGNLRPATWMTYPQLTLALGDDTLMVSAMPGGGDARHTKSVSTFAHVYLRKRPGLDFTVASTSIETKVAELLGTEDLRTGNAAFDARFAVRGSDPVRIERLLDPTLQDHLLALDPKAGLSISLGEARLYEDGRLHPDVERPRLSVSINRIADDDATYDQLIDTAILLHGKLAAAAATASA